MSHTSPRVGIVAIRFLGIQRLEQLVGDSCELVVGHDGVGQFTAPPKQRDQQFVLFVRGQRFKLCAGRAYDGM
jgi:hypothetical protein